MPELTPVDAMLEALKRVGCDPKKNGRGHQARCPAHDDRRPSLSIAAGDDGRALIHCHAGCRVSAVVEALGLSQRDLMPGSGNGRTAPSKRNGPTFATADAAVANLELKHGRASGRWDYHNSVGALVGVVCRWDPSSGKVIRPLALIGGRWRYNAMPEPQPLFGLCELAANSDALVVLVEGERCADAARSIGLLGVTSAGGAQAARKADWRPLAGRNVVILPDNDAPGERYAGVVAAELAKLMPPATVRVLRLPGLASGGDICDFLYLRDGQEPDAVRAELLRMIEALVAVEAPTPTAAAADGGAVLVRLVDVQAKPVRWLWRGRVALGKVSLFIGDPGLGKSFVTLDIAARVSTGAGWPDRPSEQYEPGSVVLLSAEDDAADTVRPRLDAAGADVRRIVALRAVRQPTGDGGTREAPFCLASDLPALEAAIRSVENCRLVVVDPISAYIGSTDSHNNAAVRGLLAPLADLAARTSVAIVAVTHLRKGDGPAVYRAMGSLGFIAAARAAWVVSKDDGDESGSRRLMLPAKNNLAADDGGLAFELQPVGTTAVVAWSAEPVHKSADEALGIPARRRGPEPKAQMAAVEYLRTALADGPRPTREVEEEARERFGISKRSLDRARGADGTVEAYREGPTGRWFLRLARLPADGPQCQEAS